MMKVLLVFLVFCLCCFSSNAQMLEEGTTVETETTSEIQGDLEKVTTTTTTTVIENKNSGAILSSESTGIVATRYEGDMDIDWGGQGSINSHTSCNGKLGEYSGSNTCASARLDSLTTWNQTVNLNQFSIEDGGQVRWEMRFGMEPSMYNDANKTAFVELKGYDGGALQWTDVYNVDKTTFALSTSGTSSGNYIAPYGHINSNVDYANGLDSLYINIGGYGEYMFDSVWFDIYYNQIETTIAETIVYNLIEQEIQNNTNIAIPDYNYNSGGDNSNNTLPPTDVVVIDLGIEDTPPPIEDSGNDSGNIDDNLGGVNNMPTTTIEVFTNIDTSTPVVTQTTDSGAGANVDTMFNNITMDIDPEQISNIQVMVADVANTDTTMTTTQDTNTDTPTVETPTTENNTTSATDVAVNNVESSNEIEPPTVNAPSESEGTNENTNTENIQEVETETTQVESESTNEVNTDTSSNENETETTETANNEENSEPETTNQVSENTETEEVKEEAQEESQPEETETASEKQKEPVQEAKEEVKEETKEEEPKKEVAEKETKEEPKKETKEEPKKETEEKQVAEKETEEKTKPEQKQTKEEKKQEQKQNKAKKIMANFDNQYDAIAQITTLALVNALGPNMSSYAQQPIVQAPTWYEPKDIYSDALIPDPLGNYFGVRDSLTFNKMIDMQYE